MSPFTEAADRLAERLRLLDRRRQLALFAAAARATQPAYQAWQASAGAAVTDHGRLFETAVQHAEAYVVDGITPPAELLQQVESATPAESVALSDPRLQRALDALNQALDLVEDAPALGLLDRLTEILSPLNPRLTAVSTRVLPERFATQPEAPE